MLCLGKDSKKFMQALNAKREKAQKSIHEK